MKTRITGLFGTPHPIIQDLMPKLDGARCDPSTCPRSPCADPRICGLNG